MMLSTLLYGLVGLASLVSAQVPAIYGGYGGYGYEFCEVIVVEIFVQHTPVYISQYFNASTILYFGGGVEIEIDIFPTLLVTSVVSQQTVTTTVTTTTTTTATTSAAAQSAAAPPTLPPGAVTNSNGAFPLNVAAAPGTRRRRDAGFVDQNGAVTSSCTNSNAFVLSNGFLYVDNLQVSRTPGVASQPLAGSATVGVDPSIFYLLSGTLYWTNNDFDDKLARFCQSSTGIQVVFTGPLPTGCTKISLVQGSASSCSFTSAITTTGLGSTTGSGSATSSAAGSGSSSGSVSTSGSTPSSSTTGSASSTSASTTAAPSLHIPANTGPYNYAGCFLDTNSQVLANGPESSSTVMTVELCAATCIGYSYFGLVYGNLCFCSQGLGTGAPAASADTFCNNICTGNQFEYCGGQPNGNPPYMQVYFASPAGLISQAQSIISASLYQGFCSSLLNYYYMSQTVFQTNTATVVVSSTVPYGTFLQVLTTTTTQTTSTYTATSTTISAFVNKRQNPTPPGLTPFQPQVVATACSNAVTGATVLATVGASVTVTTTVTGPAVTLGVTSISTSGTTTTSVAITRCDAGLKVTAYTGAGGATSQTFTKVYATSAMFRAGMAADSVAGGSNFAIVLGPIDACDAIQSCANKAINLIGATPATPADKSFDVYYSNSQKQWLCNIFNDLGTSSQIVANGDAMADYGYSVSA